MCPCSSALPLRVDTRAVAGLVCSSRRCSTADVQIGDIDHIPAVHPLHAFTERIQGCTGHRSLSNHDIWLLTSVLRCTTADQTRQSLLKGTLSPRITCVLARTRLHPVPPANSSTSSLSCPAPWNPDKKDTERHRAMPGSRAKHNITVPPVSSSVEPAVN